MPVTLYRWHLGRLFRQRFVLLEHVGRRSGKTRPVVLGVINHDEVGHGAPDGWIVDAGCGTTSDWYRNLQAHPRARARVGRDATAVDAEFLDTDTGGDRMAHYCRVHPRLGVRLCSAMGFEVDGGEADFREVGRNIHFVRLRPVRG